MQFQSCYISSDAQGCAESECNLEVPQTSRRRDIYSCCCRSNLCNAHLIYPAIKNDTNPLTPDALLVTTDGTTDQEGTATSTTGTVMCMCGRGRGREGGREREREGERERSVYMCGGLLPSTIRRRLCVYTHTYKCTCECRHASAVNPNLSHV